MIKNKYTQTAVLGLGTEQGVSFLAQISTYSSMHGEHKKLLPLGMLKVTPESKSWGLKENPTTATYIIK